MDETNGSVSITLKDVYQSTQALERSLTDSLTTLNMTMVQLKGHLGQLDARNAAADELHREQAERIRANERTLEQANLPARLPSIEVRLTSLERFKYTLLGAVIILNAALGLIEYLVIHRG